MLKCLFKKFKRKHYTMLYIQQAMGSIAKGIEIVTLINSALSENSWKVL